MKQRLFALIKTIQSISTIHQFIYKSFFFFKAQINLLLQSAISHQKLIVKYLKEQYDFSRINLWCFPHILREQQRIILGIFRQDLQNFSKQQLNMISTNKILIKSFYQQCSQNLITLINDPPIYTNGALTFTAIIKHNHQISHIGFPKLKILTSNLLTVKVSSLIYFSLHIIYIYITFQITQMSSYISYELLINLKSLDIISIRQSSFFQIRVTVFQNNKQTAIFGVPFLTFKSQPENRSKPTRNNLDPTNTSDIDGNNNTFLTRKFIIRNMDQQVNINEMCLFKGTLTTDQNGEINREIRLYIELLSYQQVEAEIVTEFEGHTFRNVGSSFLPIYFNSYKCTCNLNATVHAITSSLSLQNILQDGKAVSQEVKHLGNFNFLKKYSQQLQQSVESLKHELKIMGINIQNIKQIKQMLFQPSTYRYSLFCKQNITQSYNQLQLSKIEYQISIIPVNDFLANFKDYIYLLNQFNYQLWKKMQLGLINEYNQTYESIIKANYHRQLLQYHKSKSFLLQENHRPVLQKSSNDLFIYAFEKHETFFKMNKKQYDFIFAAKPSLRKQVIVFVHGYQASSFDMEPLSNYLKYKYPNMVSLLSTVNEGRTEQEIQQSAHRLAIEVKNCINSLQMKDFQLNFICHSLGGIIARACLKYLQSHRDRLNNFITICSPHLGYLYHSSTLISTSLWILNKVKKDPSMIELTMSDSNDLDKTYLYGLSTSKELSWFRRIWLLGSKQDEYVPYWSAILEDKQFMFQTQTSKVYKQLLENITKQIQPKIIRCEIIFNQKSKDISNLIGRTAHIKLLNYVAGIQLFSTIYTP